MSPKDAVSNEECEARVTRIHDKLDAILERLTRIEERQQNVGGIVGHVVAVAVAGFTAWLTSVITRGGK